MSEMDTSSLMSGEGKQSAACRSRPSALPRLYAQRKPSEMAIIRASRDWRDPAATAWVCPLGAKTWGQPGPSLSVWHVVLQDATQRSIQKVIPLGLGDQGQRSKSIELLVNSLGRLRPGAES